MYKLNGYENLDQSLFTQLELQAMSISKIDNWFPWLFERGIGGTICTGAVCPLITRGKNKGRPNFRKKKTNTEIKVFAPWG